MRALKLLRSLSRHLNNQSLVVEGLAVALGDGSLSLSRVGELHEASALGFASLVEQQSALRNVDLVLFEHVGELLVGGILGQVGHVHNVRRSLGLLLLVLRLLLLVVATSVVATT